MFASAINGSDKTYHNIQEAIYNEIHHRGTVDGLLVLTALIGSGLRFASNKGTDVVSPRNQHADVGFEAQRNFIKWRCKRPKTMDHWGSSYLIMVKPHWVVSGLWLGFPWLQPNRCELQTTKYPIKQRNDEYQMCNCGSLWTQVENLQIWKAALEFYARGAWLHIINVRSFNCGLSCGRSQTFGTGLKPKLTWFARSLVFTCGKQLHLHTRKKKKNVSNLATLQRAGFDGS